MITVALVGCGKSKRLGTHPARHLYTGPLFRASLAHAEHTWGAENVYIVSALHGLLRLSDPVESYNTTLPTDPAVRREWAARVGAALLAERAADDLVHVVIYAGAAYAEPLRTWFDGQPVTRVGRLDLPLRGMTQGRRLAWFKAARSTTNTAR